MYDFTSFDNFIASTNGQTIGQGECWDYINLLWVYLNSVYYTYPPSNPSATNHGVKWGWINTEARAANTINHLTQISSLSDVKRGDIVVISDGEFGHAGFADEDYNGTNYLYVYSQNYNGRRSVGRDNNNMSSFVGGWRYDGWTVNPPQPVIISKTHFPWVLYARKLRQRML